MDSYSVLFIIFSLVLLILAHHLLTFLFKLLLILLHSSTHHLLLLLLHATTHHLLGLITLFTFLSFIIHLFFSYESSLFFFPLSFFFLTFILLPQFIHFSSSLISKLRIKSLIFPNSTSIIFRSSNYSVTFIIESAREDIISMPTKHLDLISCICVP